MPKPKKRKLKIVKPPNRKQVKNLLGRRKKAAAKVAKNPQTLSGHKATFGVAFQLPKKLSDCYRERLVQLIPANRYGWTWGELIASKIIARASRGDVKAAAEIRQATEGSKHQVNDQWQAEAARLGVNPEELFQEAVSLLKRKLEDVKRHNPDAAPGPLPESLQVPFAPVCDDADSIAGLGFPDDGTGIPAG